MGSKEELVFELVTESNQTKEYGIWIKQIVAILFVSWGH